MISTDHSTVCGMSQRSVMRILEFLVILQIIVAVQTANALDKNLRIREEVRREVAQPRRYSHRRKLAAQFTLWSKWSKCDPACKQTRERYCKVRRKCGTTKQVEERQCKKCHPRLHNQMNYGGISDLSHSPHRYRLPVYQEVYEAGGSRGYYSVKAPPRYKKKKKPIYIEVDDYEDLEDEDDSSELFYRGGTIKSVRLLRAKKLRGYGHVSYRPSYTGFNGYNDKRNLLHSTDHGFYEDDDYQESKDIPIVADVDYPEEYEDLQLSEDGQNYEIRNISSRIPPKEKAVFDVPRRRKRVYSRWSRWSKCSPKCTTRRYKKCRVREVCGKEVLREIAYCYTEGSFCQKWLEGQVRKSAIYDIKPLPSSRMDILTTNSIANDYILSSSGYRAPEYTPLKLKCGIPAIRRGRKNRMQNMLKIIGGKTARKGQWPWQVVIFNRFKEAFCGGTLIAPNWVLTAAHCVRKVLYVRLGEHNLDVVDGTEIEFRVTKSIKHPNYDKKTVDSDIALLKLPRPMNATHWIGYACMPQPFQQLPKNIQCTVIGWGKRRNNDQAGTSLLHQAEVPIIPMDNCKAVYHDYTITKNMFCAGHKRGRIDTCAGDSGGPLLCRDTTRPNHPWTIFGITSFGDGCAKRNKFGIYAKVPNYVDWVWSVVNCNGNCKASSSVHNNRS